MTNVLLVYSTLFCTSCLYAVALQCTSWGRWLATERTWISVIIGVGYVTTFMRLLGPAPEWWQWLTAWAVAGTPIVARSLYNELRRFEESWQRESTR